MHVRFNQFLESQNCYYPFQCGFRLSFSSNNALMSIVESIRAQLDKGHLVTGVFIDLKKALATVDRNILTQKPKCYGVRGIAKD